MQRTSSADRDAMRTRLESLEPTLAEPRRVRRGNPLVLVSMMLFVSAVYAQLPPEPKPSVVPAFEGWEKNADETFNLLFGYFNRSWTQEFDIPIGSDNNIQPGSPDQGQPTHFFPRRSRFVFRVHAPK